MQCLCAWFRSPLHTESGVTASTLSALSGVNIMLHLCRCCVIEALDSLYCGVLKLYVNHCVTELGNGYHQPRAAMYGERIREGPRSRHSLPCLRYHHSIAKCSCARRLMNPLVVRCQLDLDTERLTAGRDRLQYEPVVCEAVIGRTDVQCPHVVAGALGGVLAGLGAGGPNLADLDHCIIPPFIVPSCGLSGPATATRLDRLA